MEYGVYDGRTDLAVWDSICEKRNEVEINERVK